MSSKILETNFSEISEMIKSARQKVYKLVNTELITLYWNIGEYISKKVQSSQWGDSVIDSLSDYLEKTQPDLKGFTRRNLYRMKQFYETYIDNKKVSPLVSQISWTNNLIILSRCKTFEEKEFYINLSIKERYSKRELERQIDSSYFQRYMLSDIKVSPVVKETNIDVSLAFKDSYVMEFLDLPQDFSEKDLLFYHRDLQCLVAFELKITEFKPEYLGKLNFYLEALDRDVKKIHENPSVGVILCASKDNDVVEYSLSRNISPALVSEYQTKLPDKKLLEQKLHEFLMLKGEDF